MIPSQRILNVKAVSGQGSYYYEDVAALQNKNLPEEVRWRAKAETPGFSFVREIAEVVSVGIQTEDGLWSWGDCVGVSYSGKSGRESAFRAREGLEQVDKILGPFLKDKKLTTFREVMNELNLLNLHRAVRYGISQALIKAIAQSHREKIWQTIQREWGITDLVKEVPIQGSSGNNRQVNADKMIVNQLAGLPHGQIDDIPNQLGSRGEVLLSYAKWLKARIYELGGSDYLPTIHLDVHGAIGKIFEGSVESIVQYAAELEKAVAPYPLRIESIVLEANRSETIKKLIQLQNEIKKLDLKIELVADEWANTLEDVIEFARFKAANMIHIKMPDLGGVDQAIEAVLTLKKHGLLSLLGGSCVETDLSAKVSVHVALATQPTALLAKPGMGIDEGLQIIKNEMNRALLLP